MRGLEKGPKYHRRVVWVVKNLKKKNKKKKMEEYMVWIGSSRAVDRVFRMPPSVPMVSLLRGYVRAISMPPSSWGCDGGRISNLALDGPGCRSVG